MKTLPKLIPGQFDAAGGFGEANETPTYVDWSNGAFPELVTRTEPPKPPKFVNGRRVDAKQFAKRTADNQKMIAWRDSVNASFLNSPFTKAFIEEILKDAQMFGRKPDEWNEAWKSWPPSKRLLHSLLPDAAIAGIVEKVGNPRLFLSPDAYFSLLKEGKIQPS